MKATRVSKRRVESAKERIESTSVRLGAARADARRALGGIERAMEAAKSPPARRLVGLCRRASLALADVERHAAWLVEMKDELARAKRGAPRIRNVKDLRLPA